MSAKTDSSAGRRAHWLTSDPPSVAVEITARSVSAVAIVPQGTGSAVTGYAAEPLPPGAVEPGLSAPNVHDGPALTAALRAALDQLSPRPKRIALVLPDTVAKVSLVRFEKVPAKAQDLDQLIRWQIRKSTPFGIDDAQVAWLPGVPVEESGREFVVTVARRDVIAAYEHACLAADAYAGIVDLASYNLMNTVLASTPETAGDWLLVHVADDYVTLAVARGSALVFFRNRGVANAGELADLVHQTAMYHEDRLGGGGFTRVVMAGAGLLGAGQADRIRETLKERLGSPVEPLDFTSAVPIRTRIHVGSELVGSLAPALGALLRERVA